MKAISYYQPLPSSDPQSLVEVNVTAPVPGPRDLLVEVRAISVNPVDTKIRSGGGPVAPGQALKILGWDAAGVVKQVGAEVRHFAPGDEVYYAGAVDCPGSYAELQCVDERLVGRKPKTLSFVQAAALPLTTITAWEMMFDRMRIDPGDHGAILIVGGAGGVGSIAIQLARQLTGLTVIATASRPETQDWCRQMGAHHVIDHGQPLAAQIKAIVPEGVTHVLALTRTEDHYDEIIEAMAPQSAIALIENPARPLELTKLKPKSISLHWEFMFTRARYQTKDMHKQGELLNQVSRLVDAGQIQTTLKTDLSPITAPNLRQAHSLIESGRSIGKVALAGFEA